MSDPMTDEERALLEHRWAVRVDLPGQASHAAQVARRLVDAAADAHLDAPAVRSRPAPRRRPRPPQTRRARVWRPSAGSAAAPAGWRWPLSRGRPPRRPWRRS